MPVIWQKFGKYFNKAHTITHEQEVDLAAHMRGSRLLQEHGYDVSSLKSRHDDATDARVFTISDSIEVWEHDLEDFCRTKAEAPQACYLGLKGMNTL